MKQNKSDCASSCQKHKKCETPTGCGSCCGGNHDCGTETGEIITTSFSMVADCKKSPSTSMSTGEKKPEPLNSINDLEIHYSKIYEAQREFLRLDKLIGITNLQQAEEIQADLEDSVYESMEELVCDINEFLKSKKEISARMAQELDVYFVISER